MAYPQIEGYIVTELIGAGSYAKVFKAFKKNVGRAVFAIKCVEKAKLSSTTIENLLTEISLLKKLKHPNIVEMKDFQWDDKFIYIIMDYCAGGDLSNLIREKRRLPEKTCKRFLRQLASALQYLRSQNVSHLDLKPQNLLLTSKSSPTLKMADFGFAQTLKASDSSNSLRGSPLYMAPEILLSNSYGAKVDLWSVGVILYECLFGRAPYSSASLDELLNKIKSNAPIEIINGSQKVSISCQDLLTRLLQPDPNVRIDFQEFFAHPFLDLQHVPGVSSLEKATKLAYEAVKADQEQNSSKAIQLYKQALQYLRPVCDAEMDSAKRASMQVTINQYRGRVLELKRNENGLGAAANAGLSSGPQFVELVSLSKSTPAVQHALELGLFAEQYDCEGSYSIALEKYQNCLAVLIEHLPREIRGSKRQQMLHLQVKKWLERAEEVKAIMQAPDDAADEFSLDHEDNCWMQ